MATFDRKLFRRLHELGIGHFESTLTDSEHAELESLLLEHAEARRLYIEYFQETAFLRWLCLEEYADGSSSTASRDFAAADVTAVNVTMPNVGSANRTRAALRKAMIIFASLSCAVVIGLWALHVASNFAERPSIAQAPPKADAEAAKVAGSAIADSNIADSNIAAGNTPAGNTPAGNIPSGNTPADKVAGKNIAANAEPEPVATVTRLESAHWLESADGGGLLARCRVGERWRLSAGQAELTFDSGVLVTVFAPADFEITSSMSIRCRRGRVTALVDERGKGFTVDTPQGKVIDLGTQFGLDISDSGETQVVVFKGRVDLAPDSGKVQRMEQGDALLIKNSGEIQRLVAIRHDDYLVGSRTSAHDSPLITDVSDNIRKGHSLKSYQIVPGGFKEDVQAFVDRDHEWNSADGAGMPKFLTGADYIMPFNDDKFIADLELTVELSRPAMLYVIIDNNMAVPAWLRSEFEDTGIDIGLDGAKTIWHPANALGKGAGTSVDFTFSVWQKAIAKPGLVKLHGITPPPVGFRSLGFNMYGIAASELEVVASAAGR